MIGCDSAMLRQRTGYWTSFFCQAVGIDCSLLKLFLSSVWLGKGESGLHMMTVLETPVPPATEKCMCVYLVEIFLHVQVKRVNHS